MFAVNAVFWVSEQVLQRLSFGEFDRLKSLGAFHENFTMMDREYQTLRSNMSSAQTSKMEFLLQLISWETIFTDKLKRVVETHDRLSEVCPIL